VPAHRRQLTMLQRNFNLKQQVYNFLVEKKAEASIAKAANITFHRIIEPAQANRLPVAPRGMLVLIVSGFLGLLGGLALVYLRHHNRGYIHERDQLEQACGQPCAGVVPRITGGMAGQHATEAALALATTLSLQQLVTKGQVVAVGSSLQGEGKAFAVRLLANGFSGMGWRVAIADMNWRQPGLGQGSNGPWVQPVGITQVLTEGLPWQQAVHTLPGGIDLLPAGAAIQSPAYLLQLPQATQLLQQLRQQYHLVLVSSPATLAVPDALQCFALADVVLYLVRAGYTPGRLLQQPDLLASEYHLKHIKTLLNGVYPHAAYGGYHRLPRPTPWARLAANIPFIKTLLPHGTYQ